MTLHFFTPGIPAPGGSKKAFGFRRKNGTIGVNVVDDAKRNKPWRAAVTLFAQQAMNGRPLFSGAVAVTMTFIMPRPKSHYGTGRKANTLKPNAPLFHTGTPDVLKLARSTEDAMTGVVWADDKATVVLELSKVYGEKPGCDVLVNAAIAAERK